jgi:integrase
MDARIKRKRYPRIKSKRYAGVYYREARRIGGSGIERVYYVTFKRDGKLIEEKAGRQYKDNMTEAKASRYRGERIEGKRPSPREIREERKASKKPWTVTRLWEEFKENNPHLKSLWQEESRFKLHLKPTLGNMEPSEISPMDADRIRVRMAKEGKSPQTTKNTLALLRRICNFGHRKRLSRPLGFQIEFPRVNNIMTEDLNPEQMSRLLDTIEKDIHPMAGPVMKMALFTGMRKGEIFKLQWADIDSDRGFITIRDPKGGKDQKIPLNAEARALIESMPRTSPFVFPGRWGRQRVEIGNAVRAIREAAGLPTSFRPLHGLRHAYACMMASSGQVDLYVLQKLLTHKNPKATMRYAHLRDEALKKAANVAGELIQDIKNRKGIQAPIEEQKVIELDGRRKKESRG